ncbi:hypothetical protein C7H19_20735 [Aphanothece hegewaldii CCALA 016]|uniref:Uncharacterized protein n=1 Tax=Aphanothece hegewaldii CCALA 016 TaxID=2107694 RepID=A0A2T1LSJ5_9CHRO|nr:type IV pilus biogenesis protein EbsA [Aphanothece hegewaldii]PSF33028.1 hypothetical protein C7H19_20735 [Aphanothece hegewaldii CCALA 016]
MPTLEQLEAANKSEVLVYTPYYPKDKHGILPYAITLYNQGFLEGARHIEGSEQIPFAASWYVSKLPAELTRCRIQFDGQADLSYEITILNAEFIDYLIDVIKSSKQFGTADFPQGFYRKLLRFDD